MANKGPPAIFQVVATCLVLAFVFGTPYWAISSCSDRFERDARARTEKMLLEDKQINDAAGNAGPWNLAMDLEGWRGLLYQRAGEPPKVYATRAACERAKPNALNFWATQGGRVPSNIWCQLQ
jgi:hypothetical protein